MKMMALKVMAMSAVAALLATTASAQDMSAFKTGPVFAQFGPHAPVEGIGEVPGDTEFSIAFDVAKPADEGARNRGFESAARFINMHVAHGVPEENIRIAVVVHGKAVNDLLAKPDNTSADMVQVMLGEGVRFIVCGQSAAAYGVTQDDLLPGVEMALSAMTAHALLQQRGYTVNPF
ncbi:DsrE family protein [Qipengyuania sp. GH38]|nr:DsrE family protein [Qipengyuania intermedia]MBX7513664.1 DsrE family protein [Qipengyuania intermedia]